MDRYTEIININNDIVRITLNTQKKEVEAQNHNLCQVSLALLPVIWLPSAASCEQHMSLLCSPSWSLLHHCRADLKGAPCAVQAAVAEPFPAWWSSALTTCIAVSPKSRTWFRLWGIFMEGSSAFWSRSWYLKGAEVCDCLSFSISSWCVVSRWSFLQQSQGFCRITEVWRNLDLRNTYRSCGYSVCYRLQL